MTRLVFTALALFAVAVGLLDLSARGTFAAASGPVAVAGQGPLLRVTPTAQRGAAGRGRLAIVVRAAPPEARKIAATLNAEGRAGITVTFALTALDVLADRDLPLFITGRGHDLAFAGYTDVDTTRLPEPIWTAETAVGQRFVESAAGREIRVYVPTAGGDLNASTLETARRAERSGLVPLLPAPAPATRGDLDGLVLV
ncbi:MAG: hypothetical protein E6J09_02700, partial [Chloroflexi bacterium]